MEKLYEENPYLKSFTARVQTCTQGKRGWEVTLDRTAFYPEGGGQPWDTGTLGGVRVLEVHERGEQVVHLCSGPLEPGSDVSGEIDWDRRFDLMQNHSGEHIVSGFAHARWGCDNMGFHMGSDVITIDFNTLLEEADLRWLEETANRYIWEDHPAVITYPSPEELAVLEYRSKKELTGRVRIVTFPGADTCACCGTHVSSSAQVGLVRLLGCVKFRDGVRVELVCGNRAVSYLDRIDAQNHAVSRLLSAKVFETGSAVERLLEERDALKLKLQTAEERENSSLAGRCAGLGNTVLFLEDRAPDSLRRLCDAVLHTCGGDCACFAGSDGSGWKYAMGSLTGDLRSFVKEMNSALAGRGGGKPGFVQGSLKAGREDILRFLRSSGDWTLLT